MDSLIKVMFKIIGTLILSLVIYTLVFGDAGRNLMWRGPSGDSGINAGMKAVWHRYTLNEGKGREDVFNDIWDPKVVDGSVKYKMKEYEHKFE